MNQKVGRRNYWIYALDIETHNDEETLAKKETSMWLGCFINEESKMEDESSYFYSWEELLTRLDDMTRTYSSHKKKQGHNILIYVYNLAFEYSFLLPILFKEGWTWKDKFEDSDEKVFNAITTKTCTSCWDIKLHFGKNHKLVEFRDLGKIFQGGIREVAKSFGLVTQKGEMDYTLNRLHGHTVTKEEKEYCFKDTRIVIEILQEMKKREDKIFFNSLSSSSYACQKMLSTTYKSHHYIDKWREDYPYINGEESIFLRKSVAGGLTQCNPNYQFKEINERVCHIDANQMHPSSAYLNFFPYGVGEYGKGKPTDPSKISCCHILLSYCGVKIHEIIGLIGIDAIDDYECYVWNFEIPIILQCYQNATIKYIDYYSFNKKKLPWRNFYKDNWDIRMKARETGDKFETMNRKLLNNGSYGKLIEKPHLSTFENTLNEMGVSDSIVKEAEIDDENKKYNAKFTYIPVGSCIPAYSRVCLIKTALKIGAEFVLYTDTDSLFFIDNEQTEKALQTLDFRQRLGGWKIEEYLTKSQFAVPKRYKGTTEKGDTYVKAGGFNFGIDPDTLDFMTIDLIDSDWDVRRSIRVKGGTIIDCVKKEIRVPSKYLSTYQNNVNIEDSP